MTDRISTIPFIVGLAIAFVGSLPFIISVLSGGDRSDSFAGSLAWQAWAAGGVVAFAGVVLFALNDHPVSSTQRGHGL